MQELLRFSTSNIRSILDPLGNRGSRALLGPGSLRIAAAAAAIAELQAARSGDFQPGIDFVPRCAFTSELQCFGHFLNRRPSRVGGW